jgi:hypothetical protein
MANTAYIKVKISAIEKEIETKTEQLKELKERLANYKKLLGSSKSS